MQMNEKVLTALEVLKDCAENDFERHRIDVLIKDLTDPPKVEIIDDKHQKFNGVIYHKDKKGGHFRASFQMHRDIWIYYNGEIPNDYVIHHQDWDATNNHIDNLVLVTSSEHRAIHIKGVPLAQFRQKEKFVCVVCGKTFDAFNCGRNLYCSSHCKNIHARDNAQYQEKRTCPVCGKTFETYKFSDVSCCSYACAQKLGWKSRKSKKALKKKCLYCGKDFETYSYRKLYCSESCKNKYYRKSPVRNSN